jgi:hypothetical protein
MPLLHPFFDLLDLKIDNGLSSSICLAIRCHEIRSVVPTRHDLDGSLLRSLERPIGTEFRGNGSLAPRIIVPIAVDETRKIRCIPSFENVSRVYRNCGDGM